LRDFLYLFLKQKHKLGTGWASHAFVKLASTYDLRIVVVSPVNHFVFTPMLASAAVGTVEYRSMTEPIRVTNPYIDNFVEGRAIGVDVKSKKVQVQLTSLSTVTGAFKGIAATAPCRLEPEPVLTQIVYGEDGTVLRDKTQGAGGVIELNYDYLICAVGTASRSSIVPGAKEHCFNLKTSQDSKRLRTAIGEALEMASRPDVQEFYYPDASTKVMAREERRRRVRIVVVGGGPTGVELSGELCDFFAQICRKPDGAYQHLREDVSVMLVHGGNELLPAMDQELRTRALEALKAQGVDVRLNSRLKEVGQDFIVIAEKGSDVVETIPIGISVWAAGNAPVPFVKELLSQLPPSAAGSGGRINVDRWLRCPTPTEETFGSILVLGDVACFESQSKYETSPQPLPQTAQVAGQQGAFVARLLNRGYNMQLTPPKLPELSESEAFSLLRVWLISRGLEEAPGFNFLNLGLLAYVGQEEALNQVMLGDVPLFNYYGKIAFALWRTVYLAKQASSRNQALIAFDWLRTETFGRDITRL
jgi:NADH dehydrogenase FAD-containing subunit